VSALILSAVAVKAEEAPKMKAPTVKIDAKAQNDAECKMDAAKKDAECKMKQSKEPAAGMQKQQMKKAEQVQKEAGKGSEKGQAMREEHSKKWWKFWSKEPAAE
jgi:hypothetical protein